LPSGVEIKLGRTRIAGSNSVAHFRLAFVSARNVDCIGKTGILQQAKEAGFRQTALTHPNMYQVDASKSDAPKFLYARDRPGRVVLRCKARWAKHSSS
jgi:hypothetical protein